MIINMTGGAGGGGLNFKVVQYTATPTGTAKENTIGVVTDTAISGWVMQAEEPTAAAGLVWIEVAAASDVAFYADKKEMVKLYPKAVKQYVDGSWANTEAWVYQNGEWVQFSQAIIWLFNHGDECTSVTGGWATGKQNNANASINSSSMSFSGGTGSQPVVANAFTKEKIDLTHVSTLNCLIESCTSDYGMGIGLCVSDTYNVTTSSWGDSYTSKADMCDESNVLLTLDVSELSGSYYVYVHSNWLGSAKVTEVYAL